MSKKDPLVFIGHIAESIEKIENFSKGLSKEDFFKDEMRQSAIVRQIEIIGEASKNITGSFRNKYPNVPWKAIIGTRDKLIHAYFKVDMDIVWDVVENELPKLKEQINSIMNERLIK